MKNSTHSILPWNTVHRQIVERDEEKNCSSCSCACNTHIMCIISRQGTHPLTTGASFLFLPTACPRLSLAIHSCWTNLSVRWRTSPPCLLIEWIVVKAWNNYKIPPSFMMHGVNVSRYVRNIVIAHPSVFSCCLETSEIIILERVIIRLVSVGKNHQ